MARPNRETEAMASGGDYVYCPGAKGLKCGKVCKVMGPIKKPESKFHGKLFISCNKDYGGCGLWKMDVDAKDHIRGGKPAFDFQDGTLWRDRKDAAPAAAAADRKSVV